MKKNLFTFFVILGYFILSSLTTYLLSYISFKHQVIPVIIGIVILLLAIPVGMLSDKNYNWFYVIFIMDSIALGFMTESWYIYKQLDTSILQFLLIDVIAALFIFVFYVYSLIPLFDDCPKLFTAFFFVIVIALIVLLLVLKQFRDYSILGYYLIMTMAFILAMSYKLDSYKSLFKNLSLYTFSAVLVGIIILIIILDGDVDGDLVDLGSGDPDKLNMNNYKKKIQETINEQI